MNEMMADDGPVPMDLGSVGMHDGKASRNDSDASNDMSYEDVCAIAWKGYKAGKGAGKKDPPGRGHGIVGKELRNGRTAGGTIEARKEARRAPRAANQNGTETRTRELREKARARVEARVKPDTATTAENRGTSG